MCALEFCSHASPACIQRQGTCYHVKSDCATSRTVSCQNIIYAEVACIKSQISLLSTYNLSSPFLSLVTSGCCSGNPKTCVYYYNHSGNLPLYFLYSTLAQCLVTMGTGQTYFKKDCMKLLNACQPKKVESEPVNPYLFVQLALPGN